MKLTLTASILALAFTTGLAQAQVSTETTTSQSTMAPPPAMAPPPMAQAPVAPPDGTLSTEHTVHAQDAYGNSVDKHSSTYRDANGVAQDNQTTRTIVPVAPPPPVSTSTSTSTSTTTTPN